MERQNAGDDRNFELYQIMVWEGEGGSLQADDLTEYEQKDTKIGDGGRTEPIS